MKSVGEVMAIGRTFKESLGQGAALDGDRPLGPGPRQGAAARRSESGSIVRPSPDRLWQLAEAMRAGLSEAEAFQLTKIDPWFLRNLRQMVDETRRCASTARQRGAAVLEDGRRWLRRKQLGCRTGAS
jgi:carbamoyl-phosphate synthase large subunit